MNDLDTMYAYNIKLFINKIIIAKSKFQIPLILIYHFHYLNHPKS